MNLTSIPSRCRVCGRVQPLIILALLLVCALSLCAQTPITTWHYNNARTGANTTETVLTPANVNYQSFGKLFSQPLDGIVVGNPLYLPGVTIPGQGVHDVVFVATLHNSVYAFDADSLQPALWVTSVMDAGASTMSSTLKKNFNPTAWNEMGVISTPVIDPASGTIYLVAETYENGNVVHRLHALDVTNGLEKLGGPVVITATTIQNGVTTTFQDFYQMNRPGLLLANGHIYVAWGSNGNNILPCQGWVMSYNATTLQQEGAFTTEPGQTLASIWQEGAGLSADSSGYVYAEDGEGDYVPGINLSTSVMKLTQAGTALSLTDWFTPYSHTVLSADDLDLTSAVVILPDQPGKYPHEAIAVGKQGTIYVLNRDDLGQVCVGCLTTDTQIIQELSLAVPNTGTPVYWNNTVYFAGLGVPVVGYPLVNGQLGTPVVAPVVRGAGANPVLTANGDTNGILWFVDGNHALWALDAGTLTMLYVSGQAPNQRDALPPLAHFASPIAADGKVFVGTTNSLAVFGLLPSMSNTGGSGQSGVVGTTLPTRLQVQITNPNTQAGVSGVTVNFSDGGKGGVANPASALTDSTGTASTSYTLPTKTGTFTVTASATGYASVPFTETAVSKSGSTTRVTSNANPASSGQTVTFTATVTSTGGTIPNGEIITFANGGVTMGTGTTSGGAATFSISTLPVGTSAITASYPGDATFTPSSGGVSEAVKGVSTTTLASSANPSTPGQSVTFTATVTSTGGSIPNGETITFKNGTTVLGTNTLTGGTTTFTTSTLPAGTDSITAAYPGDASYRSSFATISQKVSKPATTTTLHSASNPANVGTAVTFTATVTPASGSIPDGETVTFKSGTTTLGTANTSGGVATFTISTLPAGADSITASYPGDASYAASSGSLTENIKNVTTTTVTSSLNPSPVGQPVTFTATVTSAGGNSVDGEVVTFKMGTTILGTGTLSGGVATFTTNSLPAGTNVVVASYPGDTADRSSYDHISQIVQ